MTKPASEFPLWSDAPFRKFIPEWIEIRRDGNLAAFWDPKRQLHIYFAMDKSESIGRETLRVIKERLGAAAFEIDYPGKFINMIKNQARYSIVSGKNEPDPADVPLWKEYKKLNPYTDLSFL
jgi:hypothetical protein